MREVFETILTLSINASWLILAVLLIRALLWKAPKGMRYILWALVGIRLICPFTVESALSLVPSQEQIIENVTGPVYMGGKEDLSNPLDDGLGENANQNINQNLGNIPDDTFDQSMDNSLNSGNEQGSSSAKPVLWEEILPIIWIVGAVFILLYAVLNYIKLRQKVAASVKIEENLWICDEIQSPFILGLVRPRVYMPSFIDEQQKPFILAHENEHLRCGDHLWKPLGFFVLAMHWFNPLVWVSYVLMCRDIEYACDERVIRQMNHEEKKMYTESLLLCCSPRHFISACPVAFGETSIKERIKSVIKYQKPATWMVAIGVLACIIVAICFMTNQGDKGALAGTEDTEVAGSETEGTEGTEIETPTVVESVHYEMTADLNHDGNEDLLKVVTGIQEDSALLFGTHIQVYLGNADGTFEKEAAYKSKNIYDVHSENGTFVLSERDGKDYLVYSLMYEIQGNAMYEYEVICLSGKEIVVVQSDQIDFVTDPFMARYWMGNSRAEKVPQFKEGLEPWIKNATILVSYDVSTPKYLISEETQTPASTYYDLVWARNEDERLREYYAQVDVDHSMVGIEEWEQIFYREYSTDYDKIKAWFEAELATDYSKWYTEYNGSKLQRNAKCESERRGGACHVVTGCDVVYYRASAGENEQTSAVKMIEEMIRARMIESENRAYVVTNYRIPEQKLVPIAEDMWLIEFIQGYYAYDGVYIGGTMQDYIDSGDPVTADGLIPFYGQGSASNFYFLLIEKDGVYRLQRFQDMKSQTN